MQIQISEAASSAKRGRMTQSQGGAQFSELQLPLEIQAQRSGTVGIGVCEVGSLVGGALRSQGNRGFKRGD